MWRHGAYRYGPYIAGYGKDEGAVAEMQSAMDVTGTDVHKELAEAIPSACTEHIGRQFITTGRRGAARVPDPQDRLAALAGSASGPRSLLIVSDVRQQVTGTSRVTGLEG
ncbi:hypothetical protein OHA98_20910 [Streptomyces sp. NBC_00654]|uniref:hypothetical protein n=1 Tax=Streptomyces sp. NBC_00654 TaxID=2975799 RepID=UPI00225652F9|nr:hypothetical protein [Streptomyces sp. NBC_00654]MCX4967189.1 hypothetical protein [Streptomyces sp. NBC_00654]